MNKVKRDYATGNMGIRTAAKRRAASNMVLLLPRVVSARRQLAKPASAKHRSARSWTPKTGVISKLGVNERLR